MTRNKKRRVPEVLWRVYGNRARTLAETVIALLPPPPATPAECAGCKGRRCLGCSGADAMSFLLRPDDPSDYRRLLNRCFAVLPEKAPPLAVFFPDNRWPQAEIVKRTIEMILCDSHQSYNVICSGYNKFARSSHVVDLLISSAWCHLLRRIGDVAMDHLLKFASVFLPLPRENHQQVAGASICGLVPKFSKCMTASVHQRTLSLPSELQKKRKRVDVDNFNLHGNISSQHLVAFDGSLGSNCCDGHNLSDIIVQRMPHQTGKKEKNFKKETILNSHTVNDSDEKNLSDELQQGLIKGRKCQKRSRPFSWQRRKQRKLIIAKEKEMPSCTTISTTYENVTRKLQESSTLSSYSEKMLSSQHSQCFCFSILQSRQNISRDTEIGRKCMFYKTNCFSSLFPRHHIINSLKPNNAGALSLMKDIFGFSYEDPIAYYVVCSQEHGICLLGSACLYHSLLGLLKSLIRNCRRCRYLKLLGKHCTVPALATCGSELVLVEEDDPLEHILPSKKLSDHPTGQAVEHFTKGVATSGLSGSFCSKNQVVSFIWAACRSIVPSDLLGTSSNWRILRQNISKFIRLRRFEKFSLKQCMHGLKTSCLPRLSRKQISCCLGQVPLRGCSMSSEAKVKLEDKLLSCWIYWLFSRLVLPLVQANFYVTESEFGRLDMFYYQRTIWERIKSRAVTCLSKQSYRLLNDKYLRSILRKRSFGFSEVRFCPKENGVRVLANLAAPSKMPVQRHLTDMQFAFKNNLSRMRGKENFNCVKFKAVNYILRDLHTVLKGIKMRHPEKLGSSVFDYNDVYRKLFPYITSLKSRSMTLPSVFVVICDVSKAFDNVDQDKLLSVMKDVMMDDEYHVKQLPNVVCTKKSLWVRRDEKLLDQNINSSLKSSTASFPAYSSHNILVNQETSRRVKKEELYHSLYEHVKRNVLRVGQDFYLQEVGISQGSVLSSLLCSFYYAHLERNAVFPFLEKIQSHHISEPAKGDMPGHIFNSDDAIVREGLQDDCPKHSLHLLLRFVDDFLFISTSKKHAASFLYRLQRGFREYNFSLNEAKCRTNFCIDSISAISLNKVYTAEDGISFLPWSGLLINVSTLEIQADYTRYLSIHLSSTLSVCWHQKPGQHLKEKLCHYLRPKCHPIFYDSNINSAAIVRLNIYQSFLLCAMKFHCYVCDLLSTCILNAEYYFNMILYSLRYMYKLIKRRMHSTILGPDFRSILELKKKEVEWLGLNAYIRVLKKKQSRHSELMSLLRSELLKHGKVNGASLNYAVDDSHSSVFWKIKY